MQYMRIECDSCKQELVLPIEVRQEDCRCPSCGKTVAIPPHDAPPLVHRMRMRLLGALALAAILWVTVSQVAARINAARPAAPEEPARRTIETPIQANLGTAPDVPAAAPTDDAPPPEPREPSRGMGTRTASAELDPNAG